MAISKCRGYTFLAFGVLEVLAGFTFMCLMLTWAVTNAKEIWYPIFIVVIGLMLFISGGFGISVQFAKTLKAVVTFCAFCTCTFMFLAIFFAVRVFRYVDIINTFGNVEKNCHGFMGGCRCSKDGVSFELKGSCVSVSSQRIIATVAGLCTFFVFVLVLLALSSILATITAVSEERIKQMLEQNASVQNGLTNSQDDSGLQGVEVVSNDQQIGHQHAFGYSEFTNSQDDSSPEKVEVLLHNQQMVQQHACRPNEFTYAQDDSKLQGVEVPLQEQKVTHQCAVGSYDCAKTQDESSLQRVELPLQEQQLLFGPSLFTNIQDDSSLQKVELPLQEHTSGSSEITSTQEDR